MMPCFIYPKFEEECPFPTCSKSAHGKKYESAGIELAHK